MITRRQALKDSVRAGLTTAMLPLALQEIRADEPAARKKELWVNDKQSHLNRTRVAQIAEPKSLDDLEATIRTAKKHQLNVSVCGGRHAMGGQQFGTDTLLVDTTSFSKVLKFDQRRGLIEFQAGIQWPELVAYLHKVQKGERRPWSIRQKQTGVDRVTLGGTLGANAHGRGLNYPPIVSDVESFMLVDAAGKSHQCSRRENAELFSLAIGG